MVIPGIYSTLVFFIYLYRVNNTIHAPTGLKQAYGPDWENRIKQGQKEHFLSNPVSLTIPAGSAFIFRQDIPFCVIPGTNRELLCDIWTPADNAARSGVAFIYFHGSAWGVLDKDFGTRPFFKHLVSQGHVIMDVAYRLFPETDMTGMVNDVYRAIAWMKTQASDLKIEPDRIVIGGASAGGHLSLLAAYSKSPAFIPVELSDTDLSVHAVISEYGPSDLQALYYHTGQDITTRRQQKRGASKPTPKWVQRMMGKNFHRLGMDKDLSAIGILPVILGCYPDQCPEIYAAFSPVTHVHKDCPQTLILQGSHDLITSVVATRKFYKRLIKKGVTVAMYLIPQTDHAFDLILPNISPAAHTAFYFVERFLALQVEGAAVLKNASMPKNIGK
ncbi:alpha/beta hydrolase fold domain-containing protein [Chitinophaga oryziterrae]|uniref:Alpha/beta hydrolase fold domain-containing protein n=2 Tax=Chitinophaga oryziterrae TaxID=1031224 RepID=A0A6N8J9Q4_9BACT|nr:alpha/beta hydrolase fold domain-containing protein [Chitinophaga oryziterrae]